MQSSPKVTRLLDQPIGGWKITFLYKPRQPPTTALLFAANIFPSPARIPKAVTHALLAEPEIAFSRGSRPATPRGILQGSRCRRRPCRMPCPAADYMWFDTRVRSLRAILDDPASALSAHADHQTSGAFVVGDGRQDWEAVDFARQRVSCGAGRRSWSTGSAATHSATRSCLWWCSPTRCAGRRV